MKAFNMIRRADYPKFVPNSLHALREFGKTLEESSVGQTIADLVRIRASQVNGCLFCLDMHMKEAKLHGERELRLYHLPLWRESALFSEREKAALAWTELLTRPGEQGADDAAYKALAAQFSEKEIAELTFMIAGINAWNKIGIGLTPAPGALDKLMGLDKAGLE